MGQAKRRAAEINMLKSQPKLIGFGAYYKDDQDTGFSFNWPDTPVMSHSKFEQIINDGAAAYNKAIGVDPEWFTKEMIAANLFKQMDEELVPFLCQSLYGQPTQPEVGVRKVVNIGSVLEEIVVFACNVKWLQDNGYLTCDNHNGMLYQYVQDFK